MAKRACLAAVCVLVALGRPAAVGQTSPPPSPEAVALATTLLSSDVDAGKRILADPATVTSDLRVALANEAGRLMQRRQFRDAIRAYELSRQVAERLGDRRAVGIAFLGLGTVHGQQGDYVQAARFLNDGLAASDEAGDRFNVEVALNNLGIVSRLQGEYDEALMYYQRALALAESLDERPSVARTLNNIGIVHLQRGSYREALDYFQRSLRLKEANGQIADVPSTLSNLGQVYELIGDPTRALEYHERSVALNDKLGNGAAARLAIERLGRVHASEGRTDVAMEYYRRALALNEAAGSRAELAGNLANIGSAFAARGDEASALDHYRKSLDIREAINDRPGVASTLVELAMLQLRDNPAAAANAAERATSVAGETGNRETFWRARLAAGMAYRATGQAARARDAYEEAIDTLETLRADVAGGLTDRQRYLESRLAPYHRLADLLVEEGRLAEALAAAERARGRVMLDILRGGRPEARLLTAEERQRERQIQRDMTTAFTRVWAERARPELDAVRLRQLEAELRRTRTAHADFQAALYDAHPILKLSRGDAPPGSVDDATALLEDGGTALLEFMVTPEATYVFVMATGARPADAARLNAYRIAITERELRERTSRFRQLLASRDLDIVRASRDLYQLLLAPAAAELQGKARLVIIPDGTLWELPFQALQSRPQRYLLEDVAIAYAPSIAVLREIRRRPNAAPAATIPLVAVGDPAPLQFEPLPDAARQVRALQRIYGPKSRIFTGTDATEEQLRATAGDAAVLHVATHGVLVDGNPMYSFVALATGATTEAPRDGRLEAWEVMSMTLRADVVVLAACETARGRIGAGEGVVGLSWAFFLAGTPRTVVSLWKVEAASTTDLMVALHRRLGAAGGRLDVAGALRTAALELLRDPQYRHPFYWAAFSVIGDAS